MTFAALAKTLNKAFTSSSSSSSVASSCGSQRRYKASSTPPTEERSEADEVQAEGKEQTKHEVKSVEQGTEESTESTLQSETVETEHPKEGSADTAEDEGEDMDISSSRGPSPEPAIVSMVSLNTFTEVGKPWTPPPPPTRPVDETIQVAGTNDIPSHRNLLNENRTGPGQKGVEPILPTLNRKSKSLASTFVGFIKVTSCASVRRRTRSSKSPSTGPAWLGRSSRIPRRKGYLTCLDLHRFLGSPVANPR